MKEKEGSRKNLIFLTSVFPFGTGETFIENEIPFLANAFEKVFILVPERIFNQDKRVVPGKIIVVPISSGFFDFFRLKSLLCQSFWRGFYLDLKRKNRGTGSFKIFQNCWHYYSQALRAKRAMLDTIIRNDLKPKDTILYSYWLDEKALGIALVREKMSNIRAVSRAHGWDVFEERHQPPYLPFRPFLLKTLDKVAVVSKKGADYLINKFDTQKGKVVFSYLGTERINEKQKKKNEKYAIVSCSSLIALKRVELIIDALSLLDFPVSWSHIGDGPLRKELEQKSVILFEGKNIEFAFLGQLTNYQVRDLYETRYFDLFISSSETEGLPVSMMEAQSAGIPILATNVGGVNEIVLEGETGWLMDQNSSTEEIAEKLKEIILLDKACFEEKRSFSKTNWDSNFNAQKNYPDFLKNILQT